MFLQGYGPQIWEGLKVTLELSLASVLLAFAIGLMGAAARLSRNRLLSTLATIYTTLIRGVPDLVSMLVLFYGFQILLNSITEAQGMAQININPFAAGVLTLGFIYGAYFSETLRGAFMAVPKGAIEAGLAYGMTRLQIFRRILFPQMMRYALPGIGNNWQVLLKSTALVSIIGLNDVVRVTNQAGKATNEFFFFIGLAGFIYLAVTIVSNVILRWLEQRYSVGSRMAEL